MPTGLKRYYGGQDMHYITCSCYRRQAWLGVPSRRTLFLQILEEVRRAYDFVVAGYVVMPEHIHLLVSEPEKGSLSLVMQVLKQRVARRVLRELRLGKVPTLSQRTRKDGAPARVKAKSKASDRNVRPTWALCYAGFSPCLLLTCPRAKRRIR
jgi:REP element-mobilizing transposase RayT